MTAPGGWAWPRARADWTLACAFYACLTIALTWPLALHLSSALPHDAEDPLLSTALLWWNAQVLPLTKRWLDGFFFYPSGGAVAFSDHRLGLMPVAAPLIWLGASPVLAHNVTLLLTYPLSAIAAHALAFTLTKRHDAALVSGLAYGFNPFRVEHLPHLELLAAFGMPAALWSLHRFVETRRRKWLTVFAAALVVQGLCASYYLLFFGILLGLWVLWFVPWRDWRVTASIAAACGVCGLVLAPLAFEYLGVHRRFGLTRGYPEVISFSQDATSIVTASPLITAWGWTAPLNGNEARAFLGATVLIVVALGLAAALRQKISSDRLTVASRLLLVPAVLFAVIAAATALHGPWRIGAGPFAISGSVVYKPLSLALAALVGSLLASSRFRLARRERSLLAFYVLATGVLLLCSYGPEPHFLGRQFLYQPPYAWLMRLPLFDHSVRAPARFAMLTALTLSVAASLAFARLTTPGSSPGRLALGLVAAGIVIDTFVPGIPIALVPDMWNPARAAGAAAVLELPLGGTGEDVAAMYRAMTHGRPTMNGYSGYSPAHYDVLRKALEERDETALEAMAARGPLLVAADRRANGDWPQFARAVPGATAAGEEGHWAFFAVPRTNPPPTACQAPALPLAAAADGHGPLDLALLTDHDRMTWWTPDHPQQVGDVLGLDLGRAVTACAVVLYQTGFAMLYPRELEVDVSLDGLHWTPVFGGKLGGMMVRAALANEADPQLEIAIPPTPARYIKLTLARSLERDPWVVTDIVVKGTP